MAKILVVDDRPMNRQFLVTLLGYGGHQLIEAADGAEALDLTRAEHPDLIITDILMPSMDGFEFVRRLRLDPITADTPIIFYTATFLEREARMMAENCNVRFIITKPADPEVILKIVAEALGAAPSPTPEPKEFEPESMAAIAEPMQLEPESMGFISGQLIEKTKMLEKAGLRMTALVEFGLDLASDRDPLSLPIKFCRAAQEIFGAKYAAVGILEKDRRILSNFFAVGMDAELAASLKPLPSRQEFFDALLDEQRPRRMRNPSGDPQAVGFPPDHPPIYSFLAMPIISKMQAYGWLCLSNKLGAEEFAEEDERIAVTLSAQMALAYENATFYDEIQRRAAELEIEIVERRRAEEALAEQARLAALGADVVVALTRGDKLREILNRCAEAMVKHLDAAFARIWTLNRNENILELQASTGIYTHIDGPHSRVPVGKFKIGLIAEELKPHLTNKVMEDPRVSDQEWAKREGMVAFAGYPLIVDDRLAGVMAMFSRKPLSEATLKAMESVASEIAIGIERKQGEEKIREQAALLDIAQDAIIVRSLDDQILYWNKGAERLYGWREEEAIGKNIHELIYKGNLTKGVDARKSVIEKGNWIGQLQQVAKGGQEIVIEGRWALVRDDQGGPKSILVVNTDITEKKQLEAKLFRAQRMESIGTLAGGIAHDLNNVLTPVLISTRLLNKIISDERCRQILATIETIVQRGADLIKQILSFARGLEGEHTIVQARHLILEVEKILKETFPKSIEIKVNIAKDLWVLSGDATQLHQILMNLCVNARDAITGAGTLTMDAENLFIDENYARMNPDAKAGPYIAVSVSDTGSGIPQGIIDKIFDPFFTTKELNKGTGLGLSIVVGLVKTHRGFLNVYSEVGKGTQFKIYLPAMETAETTEAREALAEIPAGQGELILVVDDEASIREITKATLEAFNYKVLTASDGTEAVTAYLNYRNEVSIVLTDLMMPIMDGVATIRALRKINPKVRVIAATGLAPKNKDAEAVSLGIERLLLKPYTAEKLLSALNEILGSRELP